MRVMKNGLRVLAAGTLAVTSAFAGGAEPNAALSYYRVWQIMPSELGLTLITGGEHYQLSEDGAEKLAEAQESVGGLLRASELGGADWDIEYEDGYNALLPHLGKMRMSAKVIAADALRCADAGDGAGAARRAAALYRMADHLSGDRVLISSLVAIAMDSMANSLSEQLVRRGVLDKAGADEILTAIRGTSNGGDRFGMREAIVGEWRLISEHLVANAKGPNAGRSMLEGIGMEIDSPPSRAVASMGREELMAELGGFALYHSDVLQAWDARDEARLGEIDRLSADGERYGALTQLLGATFVRTLVSQRRFDEELAGLVARLEEAGG